MKSRRFVHVLFLAGAAVLAIVACSSKDETTTTDFTGACAALATRCHGVATAIGKECHDLGHGGDDAKCGPRKAECLAACPEGAHADDASAPVLDAGASDASEAGTDPACEAYCSCMATRCSDEVNYPFADPSVCFAACAAFSTSERTCFQAFCERAVDAGVKSHSCEHATGKLGLAECP